MASSRSIKIETLQFSVKSSPVQFLLPTDSLRFPIGGQPAAPIAFSPAVLIVVVCPSCRPILAIPSHHPHRSSEQKRMTSLTCLIGQPLLPSCLSNSPSSAQLKIATSRYLGPGASYSFSQSGSCSGICSHIILDRSKSSSLSLSPPGRKQQPPYPADGQANITIFC
jgi:hypothetical protein